MTDRADPGSREAAEDLARQAHSEVSSATSRLAWTFAHHSAAGKLPSADVAFRAARQLELAARSEVVRHIRRARESGMSWHEVGGLLGFGPLSAGHSASVADYAFDYTVGPRGATWSEPPIFMWRALPDVRADDL